MTDEEERKQIKAAVMRLLRLQGVVCFDTEDAADPELEKQIKGEG